MNKQRGSFAVELALIIAIISSTCLFVVDNMLAINRKGQMDRIAYSLATILSERKQLFDGEQHLCKKGTGIDTDKECKQVASELFTIAKGSMRRMISNFDLLKFGIRVDEIFIEPREQIGGIEDTRLQTTVTDGDNRGCNYSSSIVNITDEEAISLFPKRDDGSYLPLYVVSLCYIRIFNLPHVTDDYLQIFRRSHIESSAFSFVRE